MGQQIQIQLFLEVSVNKISNPDNRHNLSFVWITDTPDSIYFSLVKIHFYCSFRITAKS